MLPPTPGLNVIQCKDCGFFHPMLPDGVLCSMAKEKSITCPQCGLVHPAIPDGSICPMANTKSKPSSENVKKIESNLTKSDKSDITTNKINTEDPLELDKFFMSLKNILISNIRNKQIKNYKRLLALLIIKINKFIEKYPTEYQDDK